MNCADTFSFHSSRKTRVEWTAKLLKYDIAFYIDKNCSVITITNKGVSFIAVSNSKWPRAQIVNAKKKEFVTK